MSPDVYLVWYRGKEDRQDRYVGVAFKWEQAKTMAEDLYSIKKRIDKIEEPITGVSLLECGALYTSKLPKSRWQIL